METGSAPWHYLLAPVGAAMLGAEDRDEKKVAVLSRSPSPAWRTIQDRGRAGQG
jgi:hypothetical protein